MALLPAVKAAIARVDKDQPLTRVRTMEEVAAEATSQPRFRAELVGVFAAAGAGARGGRHLRRARVFGRPAGARVRHPRGARRARRDDVLRLVLGGALKMTAAGVAIGLVAAAAADAVSRHAALRRAADRSGDVCGHSGVLAAAALAGVRAAGVARDARRSGRRAATGMIAATRDSSEQTFSRSAIQAAELTGARSLKSVAETSTEASAFRSGLPVRARIRCGRTTKAVRSPTLSRRADRRGAPRPSSPRSFSRSRMSAAD